MNEIAVCEICDSGIVTWDLTEPIICEECHDKTREKEEDTRD